MRLTKKTLSLLLCAALIVSTFALVAITSSAAEVPLKTPISIVTYTGEGWGSGADGNPSYLSGKKVATISSTSPSVNIQMYCKTSSLRELCEAAVAADKMIAVDFYGKFNRAQTNAKGNFGGDFQGGDHKILFKNEQMTTAKWDPQVLLDEGKMTCFWVQIMGYTYGNNNGDFYMTVPYIEGAGYVGEGGSTNPPTPTTQPTTQPTTPPAPTDPGTPTTPTTPTTPIVTQTGPTQTPPTPSSATEPGVVGSKYPAKKTSGTYVQIGASTITPGGTVKVPVSLKKNKGVQALTFTVKYSGLTYKKYTVGKIFTAAEFMNNPVDKTTLVVTVQTASMKNVTKSGVIMYLYFKAPSKAGTYSIGYGNDYDAGGQINASGNNVAVTFGTGSVKVIKKYAAPKNFKAVKKGKTVKLSWKKVTGAAKYEVFKKVGKAKWVKAKTLKKVTFTVKSLAKGKTTQFKVRAIRDQALGKYTRAKKVAG